MPTVYRQDGFKIIIIYPNDHLPRHVHVFKAVGEIIIRLGTDTEPAVVDQIYGDISNKAVSKALDIVQQQQTQLIEA